MRGALFTDYFLTEGIRETTAWAAVTSKRLSAFRLGLRAIFDAFPVDRQPNEAETERRIIDPVLRALDWEHFSVQQAAERRRADVPDYLLLPDAEAARSADRERNPSERAVFPVVV